MTSQYAGEISVPYPSRPSNSAAAIVVPDPMKGSNTTSPASVNARTKNSTSARGKGAECDPWEDSDFTSITLEGRAKPVCRPSESEARLERVLPHAPWFLPPSAEAPRVPVPRRPLPDLDFGLFGL
jgi:hypothetical protein